LESDDCYSDDGAGSVMALNEDKTIYLASGFSGGGFKIAPWVGDEIARLIKQREVNHE
jgi:glycine/D-amino acid oxidase-like deaminating enzyme